MDGSPSLAPPSQGRTEVLLGVLRNPRLRRVLIAFLLFNIVEWATWIAVLVWAYGYGGVRAASLVALVQLVPAAVFAPGLALLAERLAHGRALALGYAAQALAFIGCGAALAAGAQFAVVAALAAVASVTVATTRPVHNALLPELSETTAELTAGNAASGSVESAAILAGPLLSGLLIVPLGAGGVLMTMGTLSCVAVALVARLDVARLPAGPGTAAHGARLREVVRDPVTRVLTVLVGAEYVLIGMVDILLVLLALDLLAMGESGPGLLNAMLGVGGLVGAAVTLLLVGRQRLSPAILVGGLLAGGAFAVAGLAETSLVAVALIAASGCGKVLFDVSARTLVQRLLPERLLTAVFGLQEAMLSGGLAVGSLLAPILVALVGPRGAFIAAGSFLPLLVLVTLAQLRRIDREAEVPADVLALLRGVPLLAVLPPRVVDRLARDASETSVAAGATIIRQGEPGERFSVIASGTVEVVMDRVPVRRLGPGDWFGELALLRDTPRTATVIALDDVVLWSIEREHFLAVVAGVPRAVEAGEDYAQGHYR
ncbi:cyclic nucleotide-binding domain-containing protein [uncultured Phycicoccus sp.]|uniref:cyclic nucleotide-binding domain-containing protein n=1 Tax=uncultured Phycicoccus sp. TaxID=661422 RepID=UPI0026072FBB|nr:cyclic nucleotide-binding domain-containing protein [uncultured Phycicoccus sp.]